MTVKARAAHTSRTVPDGYELGLVAHCAGCSATVRGVIAWGADHAAALDNAHPRHAAPARGPLPGVPPMSRPPASVRQTVDMTASTTAQAIAARCVSVDRRGPLHHVLIRYPGTDRFVTWSTSGEGEVQRHLDDATALLAAFVDLGLAHERARREAAIDATMRPSSFPWLQPKPSHPGTYAGSLSDPSLWTSLDHNRHDDDDGDPA